jgi:hypothetical protein
MRCATRNFSLVSEGSAGHGALILSGDSLRESKIQNLKSKIRRFVNPKSKI